MWMFETDFYDEHIEAVRNRAARKAYEVVAILLLLASFLMLRCSDEKLHTFFIVPIGLLGIGNGIRVYFEHRGGFDWRRRREALYQLGKTKKAKRYSVHQVIFTTSLSAICILIWSYNMNISIYTTIAVLLFGLSFTGYIHYSMIKQQLYKRPPWLKNPEEEKDLQ